MDYSKFIRKRAKNIGLSFQDSKKIGSWFNFQVRHQGIVQSLDYLKAVGDAIVSFHSGSTVRTPWVRLKHRYPLQVWYLRKYPVDVQLRLSKFARAIRLEEIIPRQVDKVVTGAIGPYGGTVEGRADLSSLVRLGVNTTHLRTSDFGGQPMGPKHIARVFARTLTSQTKGHTITRTEPPVVESFKIVSQVPALFQLPYWTESFYPLSRNYALAYMESIPMTGDTQTVGIIHASQEGGGKLRMYAAPHSIVQCLLLPIHYWIAKRRACLSTDCTNNQLSGALWAREILSKGGTIWSVDLRTATCRTPLEPQLFMLEYLGLEPVYINALKWACTGLWSVGDELEGTGFPETMSWAVGQPLGIAPSMSMFSTFHNLLLRGLCARHFIPYDSFRVLGDDVVISDERLYEAYVKVLSAAGIPISWNKCHISTKYAEFAGASITPELLLRPGQWTRAVMNNHLSLAVELKTPLYGEVSNRLLRAEKLYLFKLGLYDPPVNKWSKYLRWSSSIPSQSMGPVLRGKLYEGGCRELYSRLFRKPLPTGGGRWIHPVHVPYPDLFLKWIEPCLDKTKSEILPNGEVYYALKDEIRSRYPWFLSVFDHYVMANADSDHGVKWVIDGFLMTIQWYCEYEITADSLSSLYTTLRERALDLLYGGQAKKNHAKADQTLTNKLLRVMAT